MTQRNGAPGPETASLGDSDWPGQWMAKIWLFFGDSLEKNNSVSIKEEEKKNRSIDMEMETLFHLLFLLSYSACIYMPSPVTQTAQHFIFIAILFYQIKKRYSLNLSTVYHGANLGLYPQQ